MSATGTSSQAVAEVLKYVEEVTDGRLKITGYYSSQLATAGETLNAVRSGLAACGSVTPVYAVGELPLSNVITLSYYLRR